MKVHVTRITVEWAHCDAAGIVFYPYFYFWFDGGTERLFKANHLSYPDLRRDFGVAGMPLSYSIVVSNSGPSTALDVKITEHDPRRGRR